MRIAITGHQTLRDNEAWPWIRAVFDELLNRYRGLELVGVSCLAEGADQAFAEAVLRVKGKLEVILPFLHYDMSLQGFARENYEHLLHNASLVLVLDAQPSEEESYLAASKSLVDTSDLVLAVWDEKPAEGLGGTADIVAYADKVNRPLLIINPDTKVLTSRRISEHPA